MAEEASLEFRFRKIDETRKYILDEMKHNDLMSEKYKKTCKYLNFVGYLLILASAITGYISMSEFSSLEKCIIQMYKSIMKKKKNKHDMIVL